MTYRPTSLTARLAQIDAQADADEANGWTVFRLVTCETFWNDLGYFTAADLDAMLDAEVEKERRKDAMAGWDDFDDEDYARRLAEAEADAADARAERDREAEEMEALTSNAPFHAFLEFYQPGWA